jgi:hypothetical protein
MIIIRIEIGVIRRIKILFFVIHGLKLLLLKGELLLDSHTSVVVLMLLCRRGP